MRQAAVQRESPSLVVLALSILVLSIACARPRTYAPGEPSPKFTGTSYVNDGTQARLIVDTRAARIGGPGEWLPLIVAVENKRSRNVEFARESFTLQLPDGSILPLASYREFRDDYSRARADLNMAVPFIESLAGTFPEPPYSLVDLDFFPPPGSSPVPRDGIDIRAGQIAVGYLYFRLAPESGGPGRFKLLVAPTGAEETFVVDFEPYSAKG